MDRLLASSNRKKTSVVSEQAAEGNNVARKRALFENENAAGIGKGGIPQYSVSAVKDILENHVIESAKPPVPPKPAVPPKPEQASTSAKPPVPSKPTKPAVSSKPEKPPVSHSDISGNLVEQYINGQQCSLIEIFTSLIGKEQYTALTDCIKKEEDVKQVEEVLKKYIVNFLIKRLSIENVDRSAGDTSVEDLYKRNKNNISLHIQTSMIAFYKQQQEKYPFLLPVKTQVDFYLYEKIKKLCAFKCDNKKIYWDMIYSFVEMEITKTKPFSIADVSQRVIDEYLGKWENEYGIEGELLKKAFLCGEDNVKELMKLFFENKNTNLISYMSQYIEIEYCTALLRAVKEVVLMDFICKKIKDYIVHSEDSVSVQQLYELPHMVGKIANYWIRKFYKAQQKKYDIPILAYSEMDRYFSERIREIVPGVCDQYLTLVYKYMQNEFEKEYPKSSSFHWCQDDIDNFFNQLRKKYKGYEISINLLKEAVLFKINNVSEIVIEHFLENENDTLSDKVALLIGQDKYDSLFLAVEAGNDQEMNKLLKGVIVCQIRNELRVEILINHVDIFKVCNIYENIISEDVIESCIISLCRSYKNDFKGLGEFEGDIFLRELIENKFKFNDRKKACVDIIYDTLVKEYLNENGLLGQKSLSFGNKEMIVSFFNERIKARAFSAHHKIKNYLITDRNSGQVKIMDVATATALFINYDHKTECRVAEIAQKEEKPEHLYRVGFYGVYQGDEKSKVVNHKLFQEAFDFESVNYAKTVYGLGLYTADCFNKTRMYYKPDNPESQALLSIKLKDDCSVRNMDANIIVGEDIESFIKNKCHIPGAVYKYRNAEKIAYHLIKEPQSIASVNAYCVSNIQNTKIYVHFSADQIKAYGLYPKTVSSERIQKLTPAGFSLSWVNEMKLPVLVYKYTVQLDEKAGQARGFSHETKYYISMSCGYTRVKPVITHSGDPIDPETGFPERLAVQYFNPFKKTDRSFANIRHLLEKHDLA